MDRSPKATSKRPATREEDVKRVAGLFLTAVLTLAVTSMVLSWMPAHWLQSQPEPDSVAGSDTPFGLDQDDLQQLHRQHRSRAENQGDDGIGPLLTDDGAGGVGSAESAGVPPTRVRIPALGVDAEVTATAGRAEAESLASLAPSDDQVVGWYADGASPGYQGRAVIVGQGASVEEQDQPPALAKLGEIRLGDEIEVDREDGTVARFVVDGVSACPGEPTGATRATGSPASATLELLSCGEAADSAPGVIVTGTLVADQGDAEPAEETASKDEHDEDEGLEEDG